MYRDIWSVYWTILLGAVLEFGRALDLPDMRIKWPDEITGQAGSWIE